MNELLDGAQMRKLGRVNMDLCDQQTPENKKKAGCQELDIVDIGQTEAAINAISCQHECIPLQCCFMPLRI